MKRVFPLNIGLITLTLVGILFIQMSWIMNAMKLNHEEFLKGVERSLTQVKEDIQQTFIDKQNQIPLNDAARENLLRDNFTTQILSTGSVAQIITKDLNGNNIKVHFEFSVENTLGVPVHKSEGFNALDKNKSYEIALSTPQSYMNNEKLCLAISEDTNLIISQIWWMIAASIVFTTIIISAFAFTIRTLTNQKKMAGIKPDFMIS